EAQGEGRHRGVFRWPHAQSAAKHASGAANRSAEDVGTAGHSSPAHHPAMHQLMRQPMTARTRAKPPQRAKAAAVVTLRMSEAERDELISLLKEREKLARDEAEATLTRRIAREICCRYKNRDCGPPNPELCKASAHDVRAAAIIKIVRGK
ncbi:MAG: hypothetical protein ACREEE_13460, partial [Dongiaceae bacterium]